MFRGTVLKPETLCMQLFSFWSPSQESDQLLEVFLAFSRSFSLSFPLSFSDLSPDTFFAHLILTWCLLRGFQRTQIANYGTVHCEAPFCWAFRWSLSHKHPNPPQSHKEGKILHPPSLPLSWYWMSRVKLPFPLKEIWFGKDLAW